MVMYGIFVWTFFVIGPVYVLLLLEGGWDFVVPSLMLLTVDRNVTKYGMF